MWIVKWDNNINLIENYDWLVLIIVVKYVNCKVF